MSFKSFWNLATISVKLLFIWWSQTIHDYYGSFRIMIPCYFFLSLMELLCHYITLLVSFIDNCWNLELELLPPIIMCWNYQNHHNLSAMIYILWRFCSKWKYLLESKAQDLVCLSASLENRMLGFEVIDSIAHDPQTKQRS